MSAPLGSPALSRRARVAMFVRLFVIQGSWNYDTMLGNGVAFAAEPALRGLPGGRDGDRYRAAVAREARYFNAHPYLAAFAVGALARAECDGTPPAQIERFRGALCGPLGSIGDRLIWAGWLPCCGSLALLAFGLGAGPLAVLVLFLGTYNVGHIGMRAWGLRAGWRDGLRVAAALAHPLLRQGPQVLSAATLVLVALALPLAAARLLTAGAPDLPAAWGIALAASAVLLAAVLVGLRGRVEGWKVALGVLLLAAILAVPR